MRFHRRQVTRPEMAENKDSGGEWKGEARWSVRPFRARATLHAQVGPPAQWLDGSAPLELEIGCGVGWHPIRYASENPGTNLIAIEHTRAKFARFQSRLARHAPLGNLLPVHANAIDWVAGLLPPRSVRRCFFLYPNPEPKAANKRWLRSPFMHVLLAALKPGGEIRFASNETAYVEEACTWAERAWQLELVERRAFGRGSVPHGIPRTHFEKKYLERGQTCFDLIWRKPGKE